MLWKYLPDSSSLREGQQMGVWMKKLVAVAPGSAMSACVFGMGVAPPFVGKDEPSICCGAVGTAVNERCSGLCCCACCAVGEAKAVARVDYQTNITLYSDSMLYVSIKVMLNRFLSPGGSEQSIVGRS